MLTRRHQIVVIGAGSAGYAAARTARALGADVALIDHGPLGGLCILRGCMPSKALIASSDAAAEVAHASELGIRASQPAIDFPYIAKRKGELIRGFADYRVEALETFELYHGRARFVSPTELHVGDDFRLEAEKFIIATGSVVAPAAVSGLHDAGFLDSDAVLDLQQLPKSVIVLGGGYIGCELGQFLARMGVRTTIVLRSNHLLSNADSDIGEALTEYFREGGINVLTNTEISSAEKRGNKKAVRIRHGGVDGEIEADEIFYALGRVPNIESLGLENTNCLCHNISGIEVDDTLRTRNPNIFAIGDVNGKFPLVHVAIYEGEVAARNAVSNGNEAVDYRVQKSHTIFTDPQIGVAGSSGRELQKHGIAYVKAAYLFAEHGKALTLGKTRGFVKVLASTEDGRILGAAVVGSHGSDLIHQMIVAMSYGATVFDFIKVPHLHPTMSEIWTYPAEECAEKLRQGVPQLAAI